MATYRKPLKDVDGNFIIPAMTGDQTGWIQTGDIADNAVTAPKINWTTAGATQISTGEDLQDIKFLTPGKYVARTTAVSSTLSNCPTPTAFDMWVVNTLASRTDLSDMTVWHYLNRIIMNWAGGTFLQAVFNNGTNTWTYGRWMRLSSDQTYLTGNSAGTINTTYVNSYGGAHTVHRIGDMVVVNINISMKAGAVPNEAVLISDLPRCGGEAPIVSNMIGANGQGVRLIMKNGGTSLLADGGFTATAQYYNGQIVYLSY